MQTIQSLQEIQNQYDLFFIDLWGVTHNGVAPFASAIKIFQFLKEQNKTLVVISNAPRLPDEVKKKLNLLGINPKLFDAIITSGLECRTYISKLPEELRHLYNKKFYLIGEDGDNSTFKDLPFDCTTQLEEADFLLIIGTKGFQKDTVSLQPILQKAAKKLLPAFCANADYFVYQGGQKFICAGAVAQDYRAILDALNHQTVPVVIFGKPNISIFEEAHRSANSLNNKTFAKDKILMLGDSLKTDILGATHYGIDSVFTLTGVHQEETHDEVMQLIKQLHVNPTYCMPYGIA